MKRFSSAFEKSNFVSYLYFPLSLIYWEVVLYFMAGCVFNIGNFIAMILLSFAAGCVFNILSTLTKSEKANVWIAIILLEIIAFIFMIAYFVQDTYQNFTNIATVIGGADGVITEFGTSVINIARYNVGKILLYEVPPLLLILLGPVLKLLHFRKNRARAYLYLLFLFLFFELIGCGLLFRTRTNRIQLAAEYDFNTVVRCYGLQTGLNFDLLYLIFGSPKATNYLSVDTSGYMSDSLDYRRNEALISGSSENREYEPQAMDINFSELEESNPDPGFQNMTSYVEGLIPAEKNAYTGLLKGKNLIFLTVESMSKEMISEEVTPTLYQMMNEGIQFKDYYQPYWNGSTSTGEYANLMGLIPTSAMHTYESTIGKNLYFTIGNELRREGYYSHAYHNGTVEYYDRNIIHPNFGYDTFTAIGNGMEDGLSGGWPASDLEMIQYALPQFIDKTPFSTYFMTISGHFPYFKDLSVMAEKYGSRTKDMGYSDFVDTYICSAADVDEAVKYLIEELKEAGIYEDTVIVLAPDHYPYGLTQNVAFGTDKNYLPELFGNPISDMMERDHNALIIWSPSLAEIGPIEITEPTYSVDILPTLLNLFGLEYDSRLLAGRDVLSKTSGLVIWPDYSWRTSAGTYYAMEGKFVSADGSPVDKEYVNQMKAIVRNKMTFSDNVLEIDYYDQLFGE